MDRKIPSTKCDPEDTNYNPKNTPQQSSESKKKEKQAGVPGCLADWWAGWVGWLDDWLGLLGGSLSS